MLAIAIDKKGEMEKPTKTAAYEAQVAIEREEAARSYRKNQIVSLVGLPLVTGIGHLAPSVGAARAMLGYWHFDWPILIATSTITAFIDGKLKNILPSLIFRVSSKLHWFIFFSVFFFIFAFLVSYVNAATGVRL